MDRYAVIGNPVEHSMSPRIHAWFAERTGQSLEYGRLLAPLDGFAATASQFFAEGGRGLNVTVPFKGEAAAWVDELDPLARVAGAVNTIKMEDGRRLGFNTDGIGIVRDLESNFGQRLDGGRILLVGAGGAAAGVVGPLLETGPAELVIANRTLARAEEIIERFPQAAAAGRLRTASLAALGGGFDVVINGTSAGLSGGVPSIDPSVVAGAFCYDMIYGQSTAFCAWASANGARAAVDGIGMLVEQAAEAFRIWRGVRPETAPLLALLRAERAARP
jgi:shikimate dehydrogenase